jgi:hypothetical protein
MVLASLSLLLAGYAIAMFLQEAGQNIGLIVLALTGLNTALLVLWSPLLAIGKPIRSLRPLALLLLGIIVAATIRSSFSEDSRILNYVIIAASIIVLYFQLQKVRQL